MQTRFETLWTITEVLLKDNREPLAWSLFDWAMDWAFLSGLKDAPHPVLITKLGGGPQPLRFWMNTRVERAWGSVVMSYRHGNPEAAKRSFVQVLQDYYRYAVETAEQGASEDARGIWSVNQWH